jgi:probable rRNA maturation factor
MIYVQVAEHIDLPMPVKTVQAAAQAALTYASAPDKAELTIVLTSDDQLRQLNLQFLGEDSPTDVLSFPAGITDPDTGKHYLGDILISVPRALIQAQANNQSGEEEIKLLVVHGVLHLLGYDHAEAEEHERMWALQSAILDHISQRADLP